MTLIIDASVSVKWFVEEDRSQPARALLRSSLGAPDLILAETFSALSKRARGGLIPRAALAEVVGLVRRSIRGMEPSGPLINEAARLSRALDHSIYDCLYIALAARRDTTLVTADEGQLAAARRARIDVRLL